jgi:NAD(P)-dependent dehydrogenase (short-subunit alcohol dehydrogenase family)
LAKRRRLVFDEEMKTTPDWMLKYKQFSSLITIHQTDITSELQVKQLFQEIYQIRGRIDFLIYCAGFQPDPDTPLREYPIESWKLTFDTYLTGYFLCLRESLNM